MTVRLESIPNHRELRRLRAEASAAGEKLFPPGSRARYLQATNAMEAELVAAAEAAAAEAAAAEAAAQAAEEQLKIAEEHKTPKHAKHPPKHAVVAEQAPVVDSDDE